MKNFENPLRGYKHARSSNQLQLGAVHTNQTKEAIYVAHSQE